MDFCLGLHLHPSIRATKPRPLVNLCQCAFDVGRRWPRRCVVDSWLFIGVLFAEFSRAKARLPIRMWN